MNSLTREDAGVELAQSVLDHLNQAWDALQAGDQGALETHLKEAQAAAADAPPGVQATLNHMIEHLEENKGTEYINMRLAFLLQK